MANIKIWTLISIISFGNPLVYAYKGGQFPESGLECVYREGKKIVWLNSSIRGTIALNKDAISLARTAELKRKPIIGIDGKPVSNGPRST